MSRAFMLEICRRFVPRTGPCFGYHIAAFNSPFKECFGWAGFKTFFKVSSAIQQKIPQITFATFYVTRKTKIPNNTLSWKCDAPQILLRKKKRISPFSCGLQLMLAVLSLPTDSSNDWEGRSGEHNYFYTLSWPTDIKTKYT